jgi:carbamoyl-phosphate synthase large subunit
VSTEYPVVVSEFIEEAKEIELDAVADHGEIVSYAISEHVEFAGVHSGDATMYYPPQKVYVETVRRLKAIAEKIAKRYEISGPFNIQFLGKNNDLKVIECNIRASRSFP